MKKKITLIIFIILTISAVSSEAAPIPKESAPINTTDEQLVITENLIGGVLDKVQNGLGYAEARAKSNKIIFNAFINNQTNGYSYGTLTNIANNAIFQYRDMYLRPQYYIENEKKIEAIIADVISDYTNGIIDYNTAEKNARIHIYQSINPSFDPDVDMAGDFCYWNVPPVDSSLFTIARKLLLDR